MHKKGKLYLIPTPLGDNGDHVLPQYVKDIIHQLDLFIVEKAKTARRYIKTTNPPKAISELTFSELNKRIDYSEWSQYLRPAENGSDIGLLSEAGCPGVADPGAEIVKLAHEKGIEVVALVGPSSILLALMASGMNGQSFAFHGYLSPKKEIVGKDLKKLEQAAHKGKQTQLFIETPYRNETIFQDFLKHCPLELKLCVAYDITGPEEKIITNSIEDWKNRKFQFDKTPCVFVLGQ